MKSYIENMHAIRSDLGISDVEAEPLAKTLLEKITRENKEMMFSSFLFISALLPVQHFHLIVKSTSCVKLAREIGSPIEAFASAAENMANDDNVSADTLKNALRIVKTVLEDALTKTA